MLGTPLPLEMCKRGKQRLLVYGSPKKWEFFQVLHGGFNPKGASLYGVSIRLEETNRKYREIE